MKKTITVDTNLLLDDEKIIFKLLNDYEKIIIPITVLKELDKHKFNPNLSFSARNAIRALKEFKTKYPDKIEFPISDHDISKNDAKIIEATKEANADLATKDISMSMIAEAEAGSLLVPCDDMGGLGDADPPAGIVHDVPLVDLLSLHVTVPGELLEFAGIQKQGPGLFPVPAGPDARDLVFGFVHGADVKHPPSVPVPCPEYGCFQ